MGWCYFSNKLWLDNLSKPSNHKTLTTNGPSILYFLVSLWPCDSETILCNYSRPSSQPASNNVTLPLQFTLATTHILRARHSSPSIFGPRMKAKLVYSENTRRKRKIHGPEHSSSEHTVLILLIKTSSWLLSSCPPPLPPSTGISFCWAGWLAGHAYPHEATSATRGAICSYLH